MRIIVSGIVLAGALGFALYGAWYLPDTHPDMIRLGELQRSRAVPQHELDYACAPGDEPCRATYINESKAMVSAVDHTLFLRVTHKIPDADCQLMAQVMREQGLTDDGDLVKNADDGMNCDFARYGFKHVTYPERPEGYTLREPLLDTSRKVPRAVFEYARRNMSVTRPVYSLFRTRMWIEYGSSGYGEFCIYNRFGGDWRREGECRQAWIE